MKLINNCLRPFITHTVKFYSFDGKGYYKLRYSLLFKKSKYFSEVKYFTWLQQNVCNVYLQVTYVYTIY